MIKIQLSKSLKLEIEKIFIEDARSDVGIFSVLQTADVKKLLQQEKYRKLYKFLYNTRGDVNEGNVELLLLADQQIMEKYIKLFGKYTGEDSKILQNKVFKYKEYCERKTLVEILRKIKVSVCPYCNRQYIFTVEKGRVRAQIDHFYPKSKYPYLAVSLYNMIPCCPICNQSKSSLDTAENPILFPFEEEMGNDVKFELKLKEKGDFAKVLQGVSDEFIIDINDSRATYDKRELVKRQIKRLHLEELYDEHRDYVQDILKSHYINTPARIFDLMKKYPKLLTSYDETKNLLYMVDIRQEYWGKRPLAKLTHDIDEQLRDGKIME